VRTEQALTAFPRNDYAPDICFWSTAKATSIAGTTTVYPVPDMVCEVLSDRTEARDRGVKFEDYAAHGVGEYWIVDPKGATIEQYVVHEGRYEPLGKVREGAIRSAVIPGFEMPVRAAFDDQANLTALRELLLQR
jgi:Uma2 family endonuclease